MEDLLPLYLTVSIALLVTNDQAVHVVPIRTTESKLEPLRGLSSPARPRCVRKQGLGAISCNDELANLPEHLEHRALARSIRTNQQRERFGLDDRPLAAAIVLDEEACDHTYCTLSRDW